MREVRRSMLHLCLQTSTAIAVLTTHPMVFLCLSAARRARRLSSLAALRMREP